MSIFREWRIPVPFGTTVGPHAAGGMVVRFQTGREREVMRALEIALQRIKSAEPHSFSREPATEAESSGPSAAPVQAGGMAPPAQPPGSQGQFSPFSMPIPSGTPGGVMQPPPVPMNASGQFDPTLAKMSGMPGMMGPGAGMSGPSLPQPDIAPPPAPMLDPAAQAPVYNALPDTPGGGRPVPVAVEWERDENGKIKLDGAGKRIPVVGEVLGPMPQPPIAKPPAPPAAPPVVSGLANSPAVAVVPIPMTEDDLDAQLARLELLKRRRDEARKAEEDALLEQAEKIRAARAGSTFPASANDTGDDTGKQLALPASVPPPPPPAE